MGKRVVQTEGVLGLYNGISASIGRQMTYSLARFAVYEYVKVGAFSAYYIVCKSVKKVLNFRIFSSFLD